MARDAVVFGEITDADAPTAISRGPPQERSLTACLVNDPQQNLDQRRLPRAVGAEQTEDAAAFNLKRHPAERLDRLTAEEPVSIRLGQRFDLNGGRVGHEAARAWSQIFIGWWMISNAKTARQDHRFPFEV